MTAATIGAFAIGEYPEGSAVMIFYQAGEFFQDLAIRRSRRSITGLMDLRPDHAFVNRDGNLMQVSPDEVRIGEFISVRPGEKIPLDGVVEEGNSQMDTSAMTGESLPRRTGPGSEVLAGMINLSGLLTIRTTREAGESAAARILKLVREAEEKKAPAEKFIARFARYYTPAVVFSAVLLAVLPPLILGADAFDVWIRRSLVFLVISCPCALVVSIPLSFFGGIGGSSRRGILVKGGNYLDALNRAGMVVFDKTGTLTRGTFSVVQVFPASGFSPEELLRLTALAESNSTHPVALSIQEAVGEKGLAGPAFPAEKIRSYSETAGKGVLFQAETGQTILAGNRSFLAEAGITAPEGNEGMTMVYTAVNGVYAGRLVIGDELREDSRAVVEALHARGLRTVMLTGDSADAAGAVAEAAGIGSFYAELLPWEKVEKLEELKKETQRGREKNCFGNRDKVIFVGDGINDAPVLASSDIGIAMGMGSDAAIESADLVLMGGELSKITGALETAKKTAVIVRENIVFALGAKAALLVLGALGYAPLWAAVIGDVGVALIAILNAARTI